MLSKLRAVQWLKLLSMIALMLVITKNLAASISNGTDKVSSNQQSPIAQTHHFDVYKSPTCGCCGEWIEHFEESGFSTKTHHPVDLTAIKRNYGIQNKYQSCHTTVSNQGYVFEGHIPAKYIRQFMSEPPTDAIGLTVPGMPLGSPGMEVKDRFMPYQILVLLKDGSSEVYATATSYKDQF